MPNARNIPQLIQHITAVIKTDPLNLSEFSGIDELRGF